MEEKNKSVDDDGGVTATEITEKPSIRMVTNEQVDSRSQSQQSHRPGDRSSTHLPELILGPTFHEKTFEKHLSIYCLDAYNDSADSLQTTDDTRHETSVIHQLPPNILIAAWRRFIFLLSPVTTILAISATLAYLIFRIWYTITSSSHFSWLFIIVEASIALPTLIQRIWLLFAHKVKRKSRLRVVGNQVPKIDVFVTCCREDIDVILNTVRAACVVDYPVDKFRVIVLDDGGSNELEKALIDVGKPNLLYHHRPIKGHYKAGNLNGGVRFVDSMPGAADFIAALDADMIPEKGWLRGTLPPLLLDENCALACPPQVFYNVPKNDPLNQTLNLFADITEPIKAALGVAWCTGSGYIIRRSALAKIGSFPTNVLCSSMLNGAGYNTAYVHEILQRGQVPDSFGAHLKQRTRWTIGFVQTAFILNFCLWGPRIKHMTFFQRLSGFVYSTSALTSLPFTLSLLLLPAALATGKPMVPYMTTDQLKLLIRLIFTNYLCSWLSDRVTVLPSSYRTGQRELRALIWMAPYNAAAIIRHFFLPSFVGGKLTTFVASGSLATSSQRKNIRHLLDVLFTHRAIIFLIYIILTLAAIGTSSYRVLHNAIQKPHHTDRDLYQASLVHAFWPPLLWVTIISAFSTPLLYALAPPKEASTDELLKIDEDGVMRQRKDKIYVDWSWGYWFRRELENSMILGYVTAVFVYSWFI